MKLDYNSIGNRIRDVRLSRHITQEELANQVDLTPAHISHIECGSGKVSLQSLVAIANTLSVTTDQLLYDSTSVSITSYDKDIRDLTADCTRKERAILLEALIQIKKALRST